MSDSAPDIGGQPSENGPAGSACGSADVNVARDGQLSDALSRGEMLSCYPDSARPFHFSAGSSCSIGLRKEMEDLHRCEGFTERSQCTGSVPDFAFTAVFDGHAGRRAAEFAERHLYEEFIERFNAQQNLEDALAEAFAEVERKFLHEAKSQETEWMDGTTAASAILTRDAKSGDVELTAGNVGDTEILLGNDTEFHEVLSQKHTPVNPEEFDRIREIGGREYKRRLGHPKYNPAVISLAVSRAIGDLFFKDEQFTDGKPSGLVAVPHITRRVLDPSHNWFLVLGCDGLWDVCSYVQVADFVRENMKSKTPTEVSEALVQLASDQGSPDNITVIVVYIQNV